MFQVDPNEQHMYQRYAQAYDSGTLDQIDPSEAAGNALARARAGSRRLGRATAACGGMAVGMNYTVWGSN